MATLLEKAKGLIPVLLKIVTHPVFWLFLFLGAVAVNYVMVLQTGASSTGMSVIVLICLLMLALRAASYLSKTLMDWVKLGAYFCSALIGALIIIVLDAKTYIGNNWNEYKCDPLFMILAPFLGYSSSMQECASANFQSHANRKVVPLHQGVGALSESVHSMTKVTNQNAKIHKNSQQSFLTSGKGMMTQLEGSMGVVQLLVVRIRALFEKVYGTLVTVIYFMYSMASFAMSVISGPIGDIGDFFCFSPHTPVLMEDKSVSSISDLRLGDRVHGGGNVLATLRFEGKDTPLYHYQGCWVSANHLVFHQNKWKRVQDVISVETPSRKFPLIYCLITQNNIIEVAPIGAGSSTASLVFGDFLESSNPTILSWMKQLILDKLNQENSRLAPKGVIEMQGSDCLGFGGTTDFRMWSPIGREEYRQIQYLEPGDLLYDPENPLYPIQVTGKIKQSRRPSELYQIDGIKMGGTQIINCLNRWILAREHPDAKRVSDGPDCLYSLTTSNNLLYLSNGLKCLDFNEKVDTITEQVIDEMVLYWKNQCERVPVSESSSPTNNNLRSGDFGSPES